MHDVAPASPDGCRPLVIVGPTASGKSQVATALADRLSIRGSSVELISADSMQVYRGMDVGTAKPSAEELDRIPHHVIDVAEPTEEFSVAEFLRHARAALRSAAERRSLAIVVGGTGLYVQALVDQMEIPGQFPELREHLESDPDTSGLFKRLLDLDPQAASRIEPANRRRILRALEVTLGSGRRFSSYGSFGGFDSTPFIMAGLDLDREVLTERIRLRLNEQVEAGFLEEVQRLASGPQLSRTAAQALGYRELRAHIAGEVSLSEAVETAVLRTRQFAVRQIKWFRRDPRIRWFSYVDSPLELVEPIENHWLAGEAHGIIEG